MSEEYVDQTGPVDGQPVEDDPFSVPNIYIVQSILLMRLYDVGMAILNELEPVVAKDLLKMHLEGTIAGPFPNLNGVFLTQED